MGDEIMLCGFNLIQLLNSIKGMLHLTVEIAFCSDLGYRMH